MLVSDIIRNNARSRGRSPAIVVGERVISYAEMQALVETTAGALGRHGIGHGDRVAVLGKNSLEYIQLYFATASIGAILVPMNFWHRAQEHTYTIDNAQPSLWFVEADYHDVTAPVREAHPELPVIRLPDLNGRDSDDWQAFVRDAPASSATQVDERDPHMILYTSGTTGRPKGALLSHRRTVDDAFAMATILRIYDRDVFLNYFAPFHVGNWDNMKPFLLMGAKVVLLRDFDPDLILPLIEQRRASVLLAVPTMLNAIISHDSFSSTDVSSIRLIYYGAYDPSGILARVAKAFNVGAGQALMSHLYGLTEAGPFVTWCPPDDVMDHWGSVGRAVPGVDVALLDEEGNEVAPGQAGEICVRGPRMSGYWRDEEATKEALAGDWLHTGDVALADEDGFLTIVDRRKDMIRTGAQNVWSKQVEDCLLQHPGVADVAVIGLPDPVYEERVAAIVVPTADGSDALATELADFVRARMAGYNVPKTVRFVDELPKTVLGKVQKAVLREIYAAK